MKKYIYKLCNYTFDIIGFVFLGVLIWLIISTAQVVLCDTQTTKSTKFNLFIFSQSKKHKSKNDIEIIEDEDEGEDEDYDDGYSDDDEENDEYKMLKC